jgi:hypothetical protein
MLIAVVRFLRNYWGAALGVAALFFLPSVCFPGELYPGGHARVIQQMDVLESDATAGGFAVFQGGRAWRVIASQTTKNNLDVGISNLHVISPIGNEYFAEMIVTLSLGGGDASPRAYFSGDFCAPNVEAVVKISKPVGQGDNCLTIKPHTVTIKGKSVTTLEVHIRNTQSSMRLYDIVLLLAMDKLGFPNSYDAQWTSQQIGSDPDRKHFVEKIGAWGALLQEAVNRALAFSKPQDVFLQMPSIDTLIPAN